jgi:hypothetical protein
VMDERASATSTLRTVIDRQLGMTPLPTAGSPATTDASPGPPISLSEASEALDQAGQSYARADAAYRALASSLRRQGVAARLPTSAWVRPLSRTAPAPPLGAAQLDALPGSLSASVPLVAFHQLIVSTVALSPPAVTTGAPGVAADGCRAPASTDPTSTPTVLPPTQSVAVLATVTNCGTVTETGVKVTETVSLADPPGTPLPAAGDRGGRAQATVTVLSGASTAPSFPSVSVAPGHLYNLVVAVDIPAGQHDPAGSTQSFLLQITS